MQRPVVPIFCGMSYFVYYIQTADHLPENGIVHIKKRSAANCLVNLTMVFGDFYVELLFYPVHLYICKSSSFYNIKLSGAAGLFRIYVIGFPRHRHGALLMK